MPIVPLSTKCGVIPETPVGPLTLIFSDVGLREIQFGHTLDYEPAGSAFEQVAAQLEKYFSGDLTSFSVNLDPHGTVFQKRVWELLETIPYGETRTYGQLARMLGDVNLTRSVGRANGANPIPILYPCHRVIGANGHLTGYRGGIHRKGTLLQLEAQQTRPMLFNY